MPSHTECECVFFRNRQPQHSVALNLKKTIKMLAMDAKTQKIEPDQNFFLTDKSFGV